MGVVSGGRSHYDNVRLDAEAILTGDDDNDGLPKEWEVANGLGRQ